MKYIYFVLLLAVFVPGMSLAQDLPSQPDTSNNSIPLTEFTPIDSSVPDEYYRARVIKVDKTESELMGQLQISQTLTLEILSQQKKGETLVVANGGGVDLQESQLYKEGDVLIVVATKVGQETNYYIQDRYRLPGLAIMLLSFVALSIILAGKRGLGSLIGLLISVMILTGYLVPSLIAGQNPVLVTLLGSFGIISLTLFISHGFRLRTFISFGSTLATLAIAYALSVFFVVIAQMFGVGSEETFYLTYAAGSDIDLRGIFLAGIIIGMLGVLDDVTMGQASAIDEIKKANPAARFRELYQAGMSVGKDHIASLVNTLALAYVGASLPLFILLYINSSNVPIWITLNSEFIAQELVRSISGSLAIVLAVPITSFIAAKVFEYYVHKNSSSSPKPAHFGHKH